jgi:NADH-quinone oxidoreductase subunit A
MEEHALWALLMFAGAVLLIVAGMLGIPALLGERHWQKPARRTELGTYEPYESGIRPTGSAQVRLPIQYYLIAMFFVIFDLEAVFLYAWAVGVRETGWLGFAEAAIFASILLAALGYLWRIGALEWSAQYQRPPVHRLQRMKAKEAPNELVA